MSAVSGLVLAQDVGGHGLDGGVAQVGGAGFPAVVGRLDKGFERAQAHV